MIDELPAEVVNIEQKSRSNLLTWRGQFSPQLIEALLQEYCPDDAHVLDPFMGSGTVLVEAARQQLAATGLEINPSAKMLAQVYEFCELSSSERESCLDSIGELVDPFWSKDLPLFERAGDDAPPNSRVADSLLDSLSGAEDLARQLLEAFFVLLNPDPEDDISGRELAENWRSFSDLVRDLPHSDESVSTHLADARNIPLGENEIDFIVTSPPYINVFNYHQQYRSAVERMGWDVLKYAKGEIGSNRKNRSNRVRTVVQYCLDMSLVLAELTRVCDRGCHAIFVVGRESSVKKTPFYNGKIVSELAQRHGFDMVLSQKRVFTNRFGRDIYEEILHFDVPDSAQTADLDAARHVACQNLRQSLDSAPEETKDSIRDVIQNVDRLSPSKFPLAGT